MGKLYMTAWSSICKAKIAILFMAVLSGAFSAYGSNEFRQQNPAGDAAFFGNTVSTRWQFQCKNKELQNLDPQIEDHFKTFVLNTIYEGLGGLASINIELARSLVSRSVNKSVFITCEAPRGRDAVAVHQPSFLFFFPEKLKLHATADFIAKMHNKEERETLKSDLGASFEPRLNASIKNLVFHEFLHFAGADNNSVRVHNSDKIFDKREGDVVYACAAQVFPSENNFFVESKTFKNTKKACYTCRHAQPYGLKRTRIIQSEAVLSECEALP